MPAGSEVAPLSEPLSHPKKPILGCPGASLFLRSRFRSAIALYSGLAETCGITPCAWQLAPRQRRVHATSTRKPSPGPAPIPPVEGCQGVQAGAGNLPDFRCPNHCPTRKNQSWAILEPRFPAIPLQSARRAACSGLAGGPLDRTDNGTIYGSYNADRPCSKAGTWCRFRGIKTPHSWHGSTCTRY